ncbi:MAG: 4-(cytidine 5'-diphospho)-2-C-methyl-D-erythritol kinase [Nitrospiraceae bacterium]|nr:4-(cytidine 5'-diphospho)-2-C-methyl-D-erythritol kinase [Nitrospiraceae bacterium]
MFTLPAPAKINWFLFIPGKRDDGYHEIRSLMQRVDLADQMTFEAADTITLESDCQVPVHENAAWKAALLLKDHTGIEKGARITLKKNVPMEAGLGGGSSDAACALAGLNRLWELGLSAAELAGLGAKLGSDVPFFLGPHCSLVSGRGETTESAGLEKSYDLLLAKPSFGVSTAWAYRALTRYTGLTKTRNNIKMFIRALKEGALDRLEALGGNDLESGVLPAFPEISRIKDALKREGAIYVMMSGSGSTVFGIFRDAEAARRAAGKMSWWCRTARTVCHEF